MQLTQEELYEALGLLIQKIEACGASLELTDAVVLASDISAAVGNQWNPAQAQRAEMVRAKLVGTGVYAQVYINLVHAI